MNHATLALIQLDNADEVFTALGHASLELFLGEFEYRVGRLVRPRDEIIKVQPDKLCILLRGVSDPLQIELAGAKLERLFETPIQILDEQIRANVHAAFVPPGENNSDNKTRLRIAETGLNEARRNNQCFVVRDSLIDSTSTVGFRRAREVELAFERGEFVMYFQPKVHAKYRNVVGAESLMRWHDPKQGVRSPKDFLPYATQGAISRSLTWFALKSSIAQCAEWPDAISVAVNVSPLLLHDHELIPSIRDALAIFDLAPDRLTLEITEEAMIENPAQALIVLSELREIGIKIAIDDFGTGYSSLSYFRDLSVDELKIDCSFVTRMLKQPKDRAIVKAIIDLAHNFSLRVVAEGVEDKETADALQKMGADHLQGYWYSPPIQEVEFRKLL